MNILFTIYHGPNAGGSEVSTLSLAKALKKRHKVIFASTKKYPGFKTYIFKEYRKIPNFKTQNNYVKVFIKKIVKKEDIDIIHSHDRLTIPGAILADKNKAISHYRDYWFACPNSSCLFNKKEVFNPGYLDIIFNVKLNRIPWDLYKVSYLKKTRKLLDKANKKIAISNTVKKRLDLVNIKNSTVISNPIDLKEFNVNPKDTKKKYNLNGTIITFVGDFSQIKGIKNILKVMKDIVSNKVKFVMIGNGKLFDYTKNFISKNNLKGKIILLGNLPYKEVIKIYKASDIIVFPSIWQEPFGRIAIEAMAASKPIVASNVGGIKNIVNNKTGFLVNPNDLKAWRNKITKLIKDEKLRNKLGKQGRKEVEKYSSDRIAKQIEKLYLQ